MNRYWDTSGIIRAYLNGWTPEGVTHAHAIAEFVCVLTGPGVLVQKDGQPVKKVVNMEAAAKAARRMFARLQFQDLSGSETLAAMERAAKIPNVTGRHVHDFVHVAAAEKHNADAIVTLNLKDFSRMTKLRLESPSAPLASGRAV